MEFQLDEASRSILALLKEEARTWIARGYPTTAAPPLKFEAAAAPPPPSSLLSPIAQEIIELEAMPAGPTKKEEEDKILQKIMGKLSLATGIAGKLLPESYSVGVGFPFGVSLSFTWSC